MNLATRGAAIALKRTGLSQREIGRQLEVPKSTINDFFRTHPNTPLSDTELKDRPRSGRPRCTSERQDRFIVRSIINDPNTDTASIAAENPVDEGRTISERTIRRRAAEAHVEWSVDEWRKVMFSDESSVECGENHGQHWVWRRKGEEWRDD
ncbi:hypothetical protein BLNAU_885 [Blattamonas nauphoetae]|uniref:Uncharacterized protein n=1 Tax=Blattamonas nauphoetae TaxID=2049346 RepID=A0ABQ9YLB5_9EUKA|nr:hypothetical protein BLNAU_885 [Blattamonas nauphoetae]